MKKIDLNISVYLICFLIIVTSCNNADTKLKVNVYETSESGNKLTEIIDFSNNTSTKKVATVFVDTSKKFQKITGFGGAFTESSAYLLNKLSKKKRDEIIKAYFSKDGANYSLTRTHMNSCDFSLSQYSYSPVANDINLEDFTIDEDKPDLIPMIKDAIAISEDGFKIFASPWTAAPWMKDNKKWVGGKLLIIGKACITHPKK